ncbi:MAG: site-specific DNA-methyltransferase, partial [Chloroflexi bacterium]|nr:site-specific DNA-methyltransferase [Chloroflexota bacterium]
PPPPPPPPPPPTSKHSEALRNVVIQGDALDSLRRIPAESVHLTFTSPPYYNARDYSTYPSYEFYLDFLSDVFRQVHRVTADGRFLVVNTSPVIVPRAGRQHESHRFAIPFDLHPRLTEMGWKFIDDIVWKKPDGAAKPRNSGFAVHRQPLTYKANAVTEYVMVYRKQSHRLIDWNLRQYPTEIRDVSRVPDGYESTNVWEIDPTHDRVHSAVFPESLCERVIRYYSMVGDLVLDPFAGSGTLGAAAHKLKRDFLLLEINEQYVKRIQQRLGMLARTVSSDNWSK